jgi:6-phosphogluconolactonase
MRTHICRTARLACAAAVPAALAACGGGDAGAVAPITPVTAATYTVGGTVTGLAGPGLVLENYMGFPADDLAIGTSGSFTFGKQLLSGAGYAIDVKTQPLTPPQYCQVTNDTGTVGTANVSNVQVTCAAGFTVGGTVSGLAGAGLVVQIENNQLPNSPDAPGFVGSPLAVNTNGAFTLDSVYPAMFSGGDFVKITQQPSSPTQRCLLENAGIDIQGANDTRVAVACSEFAYVSNATDNTLSAYRVDPTTGGPVAVGTPIATGKSPYALVGTDDRKFLYVGNEGSNDISVFAVDVATGALTAVPGSPFAAGTDPRGLALFYGYYLYVANTGSDTVSAFAIDATGALTPLSPATYATGHGPSSVAVDSADSFLYVTNNGGSDGISAFVIDPATGGLSPVAGSPFAAGANPFSLAFGAGGKFLYVANPGTNPSISGFAVDSSSGALTPLGFSPFPAAVNSHIATDPSGAYLYVTTAAGVVGYAIDATTGLLTSLPGFPVVAGANAYSISLDPTSQFLYVANSGSADVSGFRFDAATGGLTPITGSPFAAGNQPEFVATF